MADADALRESGVGGRPVTPEPGPLPPPTAAPGDETVMSLIDHLGELRSRLFRAILAVAVFSVVGFYASDTIVKLLADAIPGDSPLYFMLENGLPALREVARLLVRESEPR